MSGKYMHEYNKGKCACCGLNACYETDERGDRAEQSELMRCSGCQAVAYCCKEHQKADWPNHKKFCKRFQKLIAEYKTVRDSRPRGSPKPAKPSPYPLHDFIEEANWQGLLQYVKDHPEHDLNEIDQRSPQFMSPLLLACGQGQIECVHILLDRGANFMEECGSINLTPLQYASWWGHDDIVQLLLNRGADVNQANAHDTFALGFAATHLQPKVVKLLLRYGADVDQRNFVGWTALMQSVCAGRTLQEDYNTDNRSDLQKKMEDGPKIISIVKMLLNAGADINARGHSSYDGVKDFRGDTALNLACDANKLDVLEFLISEGALLDVQRDGEFRA